MIKGLVGSSPPLQKPVHGSKDRESSSAGFGFDDILNSKKGILKEEPKTRNSETLQSMKQPNVATPRTAHKRADYPQVTQQKAMPQRAEPIRDVSKSMSSQESLKSEDLSPEPESQPKVLDSKLKEQQSNQATDQRQKAIRKFMDSFESEFGIPPEQLVEAIAQLKVQDLEQPPEATVDNVISELNLDPQDEMKAKGMYVGLLAQLSQIETKSSLPIATDNLLSQMSSERLHLSNQKKEFMAGQVQALNDKFWMKDAGQEKSQQLASNSQILDFIKQNVGQEGSSQLAEGVTLGSVTPQSTEDLLGQLQKIIDKSEGIDSSLQLEDLNVESLSFTPNTMKSQSSELQQQNQDSDSEYQQTEDEDSTLFQVAQSLNETNLKKTGKSSPVESKKIEEPKSLDLRSLQLGDISSSISPRADFEAHNIPASMAPGAAPSVTEQQKSENIQQILNQTQTLIKKGGGEVNVEMTPEGLGSIHMKLQVLDGKVQLHMNTESKEAKKMIESSMHDLKQSLAAHQLSMDHVKVDVVAQASSSSGAQNDLQNQMQNFFEQQQREGTKQFWQQFNENFGNRQARENYFDAQGIRTGIRRQDLPGIQDSGATKATRHVGNRGRSLNLVA